MLSELINPVHFFLALAPLAVYLLLLGIINLSSRPFVTTGARDTAALGLGIGGFVVIGPLQLLLPSVYWFLLGSRVWLLLVALYVVLLSLCVLMIRPRLVIYNMRPDRLRPMLGNLVTQLDCQARWAGNCLVLPQLGVQLHIESSPALRNVQLVAAGAEQSYEGWKRLHAELAKKLPDSRGARNPFGFSLVFCGLMAVGILTFWFAQDPQTVAQTVQEIFRLTPQPQ